MFNNSLEQVYRLLRPFVERACFDFTVKGRDVAGISTVKRFEDGYAATLLLSLGIYPKVVQELFGHTQINMTEDIYSHVLPDMQLDAVHNRLHDLHTARGCEK